MPEPIHKRIEEKIRSIIYKSDYLLFRLKRNFFSAPAIDKDIKKILVIEFTMIGDLLVATPTFTALKKMFPKAKIDVMMFKKFESVIKGNEDVNKTIGLEKTPSIFRFKEFSNTLSSLKSNNYDMGVIMHHGSFSNSLLLLLSNLKYRVGCIWSGILKGKGFFLTHKNPPQMGDRLVVLQNLDIINTLDDRKKYLKDDDIKIKFPISNKDKAWALQYIKDKRISMKRPIIVIHPGTRHQSHEWFNERFINIADWLIEKHKAQIIFTGDDHDYKFFVKNIQEGMRNQSTYLKADLNKVAAVLERCNLLFSVDTGMVHIGSATGIPVLGLYGSGKPNNWAPWGKNNKVIFNEAAGCVSCRRPTCNRDDYICMSSISIEQVKKTMLKMLRKKR